MRCLHTVPFLCLCLQLLEANSMKGGVELLEIRPEQLTSHDLGEQQVLWNNTLVLLVGGKFGNSMACN